MMQNKLAAPPPLAPGKVKKMSDAQIRQWIRQHGFEHLPEIDIQIECTTEEIEVTIKPDETTSISTSYKVK
jgi:ribonuclease I